MQSKSKLTFWEMWNLSFGFFGTLANFRGIM